ncbi:MAG: TolC family protein [Rhizobiales bacterium]|uniref:TolC family protein n=1 Tax=Azorhizobium caulinodans TaxID=7 RepID=UPI001AC0C6F0|nr:TolC family protein [Hyphomicrobiales bacterium]
MDKRTFAGAGARARRKGFVVAVVLACGVMPAHAKSQKPLTVSDAITRAVNAGFALPAAGARVQAGEAGIRQAGRGPNPTVGIESENFAGSGPYQALNQPETTVYFQQTFELGDKAGARTGVARSELEATRARSAVRVLDLMREVELAWIEVLVAAAQEKVAQERLVIAQQFQAEIARRADAGRDPLFTQSRAEAQVALEQIAVDQAKANARIARANLAGYWRGSPDFAVDLPAFENAVVGAESKPFNADVALLEAEREVATARIGLEQARAVQDPALRFGVRHFADTNDGALVAGIAIPLPLFDTNQDNIEKARAERQAAELDVEAARATLKRELTRLGARLAASAAEARRIQREVVPKAEQAVRLIREGMERGAFSYVEFMDAQRTLNDARLRRIEALRAFHQDNATVSRLTGRHSRLNIKG